MLAIIQNPKLLAGFLAAIAVVIIVIVIFMMIRGDDALGKIVYASEGDLGIRVYLLDGADEDPVSLMKDITSIKDLIRSPSDDQTLVIADTGDGMAITLLFDDPDLSANTNDIDSDPLGITWAPDGQGFAFAARDDDGLYSIMISNDGSSFTSLLSNSESVPTLGGWSSNFDWFTYALTGDPETQGVYIKDPDGVNILRLTGGVDFSPRWSPNGERIAYLSQDDDGAISIFVIYQDGSGPIEISGISENVPTHNWSSNSERLVFVNDLDIFTIGADGEDMVQLTVNNSSEVDPQWSKDGSEILFSSDTNGDFDLFVMNADGSDQRRVSRTSDDEMLADW